MPTKTLLPPPYLTLEDSNGLAIANGTVTFLEAGTAVLAVVYADAEGLVASANPLTVDGAGRYTVFVTPGQTLDVEYRDAEGALLKTVPGVQGVPGTAAILDWQHTSLTGVVPMFTPTSAVVLLENPAPLTIQGMAAGYHGQQVRFIVTGSCQGLVLFEDASAAAPAAQRLYNLAQSAPTPLAEGFLGGNRGTVAYLYDGTVPGWRLIVHEQGGWITPPFDPADYGCNGGGPWTVEASDVQKAAYYLRGRELTVLLLLNNTSVGSQTLQLTRTIPGGYRSPALASMGALVAYLDPTGAAPGAAWSTQPSQPTKLIFARDFASQGTWPVGSNSIYLAASMTFEVL